MYWEDSSLGQGVYETTLVLLYKLFLYSCLWLIKLTTPVVLVLAAFLLQRCLNLLQVQCMHSNIHVGVYRCVWGTDAELKITHAWRLHPNSITEFCTILATGKLSDFQIWKSSFKETPTTMFSPFTQKCAFTVYIPTNVASNINTVFTNTNHIMKLSHTWLLHIEHATVVTNKHN